MKNTPHGSHSGVAEHMDRTGQQWWGANHVQFFTDEREDDPAEEEVVGDDLVAGGDEDIDGEEFWEDQVAATVSKMHKPFIPLNFKAIRQGYLEGGLNSTDRNLTSSTSLNYDF